MVQPLSICATRDLPMSTAHRSVLGFRFGLGRQPTQRREGAVDHRGDGGLGRRDQASSGVYFAPSGLRVTLRAGQGTAEAVARVQSIIMGPLLADEGVG